MENNLENIFKKLEGKFDFEEPDKEHLTRFKAKLYSSKKEKKWRIISIISAAASIILVFGIWLGNNLNNHKGKELASISAQMAETQNYFITTINTELKKVKKQQSETTNKIISDTLNELKKLEQNYQHLTLDLQENAGSQRVIYAMINNFQQRIELLQSVLKEIEKIKKQKSNEIYI